MDYDRTTIPSAYDRARSRSPEVLSLWMDIVASGFASGEPGTILDLGCGTGRFSAPLRARFPGRILGIDPSSQMLAQARAKLEARGIHYVRAGGEAIPLRSGSVDLVFISMAFHHFTGPGEVVRECRRVLRAGGRVFLRAGTADRIGCYALTPFFPAAVPIMRRVLESVSGITRMFAAAGFASGETGMVNQPLASTHAEYADQLEAGGDSVLAQLSARDLAEGLRALRTRAGQIDPTPVAEPVDFLWFARER